MHDQEGLPKPLLQQRPEDCLAGGGRMGELMRSTDWSRTVFGPVDKWPQSLRTAISIMLESRFAMVVAWGPEFRFFYNDGYAPILGTKHPMALGTPGKVIFPEVWSVVGPEFERIRHGESFGVEDWLLPLDRNGYIENCWFTLSYSPIRDETGGVGGLLAVVTETTRRVESERRLATLRDLARRAADATTAEEACRNAADVFEHNPIDVPFALFYLIETGGDWARRVAAAGPVSGKATPERIALRATPGASRMEWPLDRVLQSGRPQIIDDLPTRFGPLTGGPYSESTHTAILLPIARPGLDHPYGILVAGVCPRRSLDERYRGFFDLAADHIATAISNARALEAERQRAEALAEIDRAKTAFFNNVSHEFRTPLTLLLGPTEDALRQPCPVLAGESLHIVHRNALRMLKLVNTLLDFARIESGRIEATYQPTNLVSLTEELVSGFRSAVERAGLTLEFMANEAEAVAFVDRQMWEKIVLNLLSNALKFTFAGTIRVTVTATDRQVELSVADTGVGIPEQEVPRVFERFHRVEGTRSRTHEGTGIGLALVQELVRLHGGSIRVHSKPDVGSDFIVVIPTGSAHLPQERLKAPASLPPTALGVAPFREEALRWIHEDVDADYEPPVEPQGRILVADDNADMRNYLVRILRSRWNVAAVADGQAALQAATVEPPDVVLSDIMMPGLDGLQLLRALRANPQTRDVRVILLSARAAEEARLEGMDAGADDYLTKPFSARELTARVNSQMTIARAHRRISQHRNDLYALFMQAPAPICVLRGRELRFEMANSQYLKVAGRSEVIGRTFLEVFPELAGQGVDQQLREVLDNGEPHVAREVPVRVDRGKGLENTWFTVTYAPLTDDNGVSDRVMCFLNEVTYQVLARREAERASRAKDEFLAVLSHELRNPLAPIVTAMHVIKTKSISQISKETAIIERQLRYMVRLVDDLLDVARITRGKLQLQLESVQLSEIVSEAVDIVSPLVQERSQHLAVDVTEERMMLRADRTRLTQVIVNLLTNASKFSDPEGRIEISASRQDDGAVVIVRDSGRGIPKPMLPLIFEAFTQAERSDEEYRSGLGLGLAIVKSLTELHGGHVTADSEGEGKGSVFTLRLPLEKSVA